MVYITILFEYFHSVNTRQFTSHDCEYMNIHENSNKKQLLEHTEYTAMDFAPTMHLHAKTLDTLYRGKEKARGMPCI